MCSQIHPNPSLALHKLTYTHVLPSCRAQMNHFHWKVCRAQTCLFLVERHWSLQCLFTYLTGMGWGANVWFRSFISSFGSAYVLSTTTHPFFFFLSACVAHWTVFNCKVLYSFLVAPYLNDETHERHTFSKRKENSSYGPAVRTIFLGQYRQWLFENSPWDPVATPVNLESRGG